MTVCEYPYHDKMAEAENGSDAGARWHRKRGEPACARCAAASARYRYFRRHGHSPKPPEASKPSPPSKPIRGLQPALPMEEVAAFEGGWDIDADIEEVTRLAVARALAPGATAQDVDVARKALVDARRHLALRGGPAANPAADEAADTLVGEDRLANLRARKHGGPQ